MAGVPTLDELRQWFNGLSAEQRICRVMCRTESCINICGREAVGLDRLGGPRGLVCESHRPEDRFFIPLKRKEP